MSETLKLVIEDLHAENKKLRTALLAIAAQSTDIARLRNMKQFPVAVHLCKRLGNTAAEAIGHRLPFEEVA